jgi:leucine dehydrogenase
MFTFEKLYSMGHEEVVFFSDPSCNLKAIIAIHNTTLGPALGGTRMWNYKNIDEAVEDVLRLSRGMSYKNSISGLHLGGGKAVIIGDPAKDKSEALFRSYGRFVESLNGRYITAEDVNTSVEDMEFIARETDYVAGISEVNGGSGNPSPWTALGVFRGMEASCLKVYGDKSLKGKVVALQGAGSVGCFLGKHLFDAGAKVYFTDINEKNIERFKAAVPNAEFVGVNDIYDVKADIYAPCALGATINDQTIERLKVKIVCGAANNQLAESRHGDILKERGILYAPDYLVNGGGVMSVYLEFEGWTAEKATKMVNGIFEKTLEVFKLSEEQNIPVYKATDMIAEKRIASIKAMKGTFLGHTAPRFLGRKSRY